MSRELTEAVIRRRALRMFNCDAACVSCFAGGTMYLILGWNRRSKGDWFRDGKPFDFDYLHEQVVAHGKGLAALWASARHYKKLLDLERRHGRLGAWRRILADPSLAPSASR